MNCFFTLISNKQTTTTARKRKIVFVPPSYVLATVAMCVCEGVSL